MKTFRCLRAYIIYGVCALVTAPVNSMVENESAPQLRA
jgi:hypothetical protein